MVHLGDPWFVNRILVPLRTGLSRISSKAVPGMSPDIDKSARNCVGLVYIPGLVHLGDHWFVSRILVPRRTGLSRIPSKAVPGMSPDTEKSARSCVGLV